VEIGPQLTPPHVLIFICNFNKTIFLWLGLVVGRWTLIDFLSGYQSFCRLMYWVYVVCYCESLSIIKLNLYDLFCNLALVWLLAYIKRRKICCYCWI
jgi:hypothetical protein